MVALYPDAATARLLALSGAYGDGVQVVPAEELHLTLGYFPSVEADDYDEMIQCVAAGCMYLSPIVAHITGSAQFMPQADAQPPLVPHVLLIENVPALESTRWQTAGYVTCCEMSREHPFLPHITRAYAPLGAADAALDSFPPDITLTFDRVSLVIGDAIRHDFMLGGMSAGGAYAMPAYRATWSTAFVNDLPDSAFLYIEGGGKKVDGKTEPRSLRHLPYKDADGAIDMPHLRNAIARIPQTSGLSDSEKEALQKRAQALLAKQKAGRRVAGGWRKKIAEALDTLKAIASWADYEDEVEAETKTVAPAFHIIKQADGRYRWLAVSATAFEDREGEIIETKAIEEDVARADKDNDRGPLRLWHTPGAEIGTCDFQAMEGRMLLESGLFDDTDAGQKALAYVLKTTDKLGVSVGFVYPESAFDGKSYSKIHILERSLLPHDWAANPYTTFHALKEEHMDDARKAFFTSVVGDEIANTFISSAAEASKALEGQVAFKEAKTKADAETAAGEGADAGAASVDGTATAPSAEAEAAEASEKAASEAAERAAKPITVGELGEVLKAVFEPLGTAIKSLVDTTKLQTERLETLEAARKEDAERAAVTPRGAGAFRATAASDNIIAEGEKVIADALARNGSARVDGQMAITKDYLADLGVGGKGGI